MTNPTNSRRAVLSALKVETTTHAGLWLDKFLPAQDHAGGKGHHIRDVERIGVPTGYPEAMKRRTKLIRGGCRPGFVAEVTTAKAQGRLAIGLGQKSVLEVGLTLDHTWGVPYIPGSALKGIAAWAARASADKAWHAGGASYLALFGDTEEAAAVHFLDAWWQPGPNDDKPITLDTITVHHKKYYQGEDPMLPLDTDSPVPIAFASVTGTFEVILEGPKDWVDAALQLLKRGLADHGVGAKTAGGYGRLDLKYLSLAEQQEAAAAATANQKEAEAVEAKKRAVERQQQVAQLVAGNANDKVPKLLAAAGKDTDLVKRQLAEEIIKKFGLKVVKAKPWGKDVLAWAGKE